MSEDNRRGQVDDSVTEYRLTKLESDVEEVKKAVADIKISVAKMEVTVEEIKVRVKSLEDSNEHIRDCNSKWEAERVYVRWALTALLGATFALFATLLASSEISWADILRLIGELRAK